MIFVSCQCSVAWTSNTGVLDGYRSTGRAIEVIKIIAMFINNSNCCIFNMISGGFIIIL